MKKGNFLNNINEVYIFVAALVIGLVLAVGASVWATSIGNGISVSTTLDVTGATTLNGNTTLGDASTDINLFTGTLQASTTALFTGASTFYGNVTLGDAAGDSVTMNAASLSYASAGTTTIIADSEKSWSIATTSGLVSFVKYDTSNYRVGIGTSTPGATLAVGGAGNIYGLGNLTIDGNTVLGNATGDSVTFTGSSLVYSNTGTTTIPASSEKSWSIATTSALVSFVKYDTSNYAVGIGTSTPGATLAVGGSGNIYALGNLTIDGNAVLGNATGDSVTITGSSVVYSNTGTTTIPASSEKSWSIATSSALVSFVKYDTSNYRVGIGTSTPGATLAVGGSGSFYAAGNASISGTTQLGNLGTAVTQLKTGYISCGALGDGNTTIATTTVGTLLCSGLTDISANDAVFLTASTTALGAAASEQGVIYTGAASSSAANLVQIDVLNLTGKVYTIATTTWRYLIIR